LGDDPFTCTPRASSNNQLANECSCEGNVADVPETQPLSLPAQFIHGDHLSPAGFVALYSTDVMGPAFPVDIPRKSILDPCCMCNYFLEQIYFSLDSGVLPVDSSFDPALGSTLDMKYTWSRVPHGMAEGFGEDGIFNATENLSQNYVSKQSILTTRPSSTTTRISKQSVSAYFPSTLEAFEVEENSPAIILVSNFNDDNDPKLLGGKPATEGRSRGEDEQITLDFTFNAYTQIKAVNITFLAGKGREVPQVILTGIPPQNRTGNFVTTRAGIILGTSSSQAQGTSVPDPTNRYASEDIRKGEVLFPVSILPADADQPFWDKFFQEFHLIFLARDPTLSMGVHSIELIVDSLTATVVETIRIPERRYYTSTFSPTGDDNPEENLTGMDSCSAYWRNTSTGAKSGGNRHRAYSWGPTVGQESGIGQGGGQPIINLPLEALEKLQVEEYDKARALMGRPYTYSFSGFFPLEEQRWIDFLSESAGSWTTTLSVDVSGIEKISTFDSSNDPADRPLYGSVPQRSTFQAPGHCFKHVLDSPAFNPCREGQPDAMLISYNFAHLHDGLAEVENAGFWADFSSGPSFGSIAAAIPAIINNPDVSFIEVSNFSDGDGNPISVDILNASGFRRTTDGRLVIVEPPG